MLLFPFVLFLYVFIFSLWAGLERQKQAENMKLDG
jgi:preprotein translocase subunit YajC